MLAFGMFRSRREEYTLLGWRLVLIQRTFFVLIMLPIFAMFTASIVSGR